MKKIALNLHFHLIYTTFATDYLINTNNKYKTNYEESTFNYEYDSRFCIQ